MNLKHFYYRTYFEGYEKGHNLAPEFKRLDLQQHPKGSEERKTIDKSNEKLLKAKNYRLTQSVKRGLFTLTDLVLANVYSLPLEVQNPGLLIGGGYPHEVGYAGEFKLGLHFDHTGGLPVLPGSSVKGALRSLWPQYEYVSANPAGYRPDKEEEKAALQHKKAGFIFGMLKKAGIAVPEPVQTPEVQQAFVHRVEQVIFEGWDAATFDKPEPSYLPGCKRAVFFDAFPVASGGGDVHLLGRDALTPHGTDPLKNPIPLPFVKVLPGVHFEFRFRLPDLYVQEGVMLSAQHLILLFASLLERTGIGAKTNVGYGRLETPGVETGKHVPTGKIREVYETRENTGETAKPKPPAMLEYKKSLGGKLVIVTVVAVEGNVVHYQLENVRGVEGARELKHASAGMLRPGCRYEWRVSEANPEKNILNIRIESFKPLE